MNVLFGYGLPVSFLKIHFLNTVVKIIQSDWENHLLLHWKSLKMSSYNFKYLKEIRFIDSDNESNTFGFLCADLNSGWSIEFGDYSQYPKEDEPSDTHPTFHETVPKFKGNWAILIPLKDLEYVRLNKKNYIFKSMLLILQQFIAKWYHAKRFKFKIDLPMDSKYLNPIIDLLPLHCEYYIRWNEIRSSIIFIYQIHILNCDKCLIKYEVTNF